MLVHEDRLFPADPATRAVARRLYDSVRDLPIVSPARPYRSALVRAERAVSRSGAPLRRAGPLHLPHALQPGRAARGSSASPRRDGGAGRGGRPRDLAASSPSTTRSSAARRPEAGSTTPSRRCSASRSAFRAANADRLLRHASPRPWRSRSTGRGRSFERFNIEVIATTESPLDELEVAPRRSGTRGWSGRVVTAYRPDPVVDPDFEGFSQQPRPASARSPAATRRPGRAISPPTASGAPSSRRFGATSTDHGHPTAAHRRPVASRGGGAVPARRAGQCRRPRMRSCSAPRC